MIQSEESTQPLSSLFQTIGSKTKGLRLDDKEFNPIKKILSSPSRLGQISLGAFLSGYISENSQYDGKDHAALIDCINLNLVTKNMNAPQKLVTSYPLFLQGLEIVTGVYHNEALSGGVKYDNIVEETFLDSILINQNKFLTKLSDVDAKLLVKTTVNLTAYFADKPKSDDKIFFVFSNTFINACLSKSLKTSDLQAILKNENIDFGVLSDMIVTGLFGRVFFGELTENVEIQRFRFLLQNYVVKKADFLKDENNETDKFALLWLIYHPFGTSVKKHGLAEQFRTIVLKNEELAGLLQSYAREHYSEFQQFAFTKHGYYSKVRNKNQKNNKIELNFEFFFKTFFNFLFYFLKIRKIIKLN